MATSMYFLIHYSLGIESYFEYFKSFALHTAVLFLVLGFYERLKNKPKTVFKAIESLTNLNFIATLLAICVFAIPSISSIVWRTTYSADKSPQLRMLTYEPSYYCLLLIPLFFYYVVGVESNKSVKNFFLLITICLSFLLSRSLGVVACILISLSINYVKIDFLKKRRNLQFMLIGTSFAIISLLAFIIINPNSALVVRTINFFQGKDVSGSARVIDAWILGYRILEQKSLLFGVGWGHIKILGHEIISDFYNYGASLNKRVTIPNSAAEIFVFFGFLGLLIKVFFEIFLYKKTRVKRSRYRSFLFWFIFIYQFTGSFSSNLAEYVIWVLAFTNVRLPSLTNKTVSLKIGK